MRLNMTLWLASAWLSLVPLAAAHTDPAPSCNPPIGWEAVAEAGEGRVLFIGEVHGTRETPEAFASYVCAATAKGGRTLVLVEVSSRYAQAMAQAAVSEDPRAALLSDMQAHWQTQDGRGSVAMLDMMARIMVMAQSGQDISVEPFSLFLLKEFPTPEETMTWVSALTPAEIQEQTEAGMAKEILARSAGFDRTIVLVGNVHAYLDFGDEPMPPSAAMRVPGAISLRVADEGGDAWVQMNGTAGVRDYPRRNPYNKPAGTMGLDEKYEPHFNGYLSVGAISASPPALLETP